MRLLLDVIASPSSYPCVSGSAVGHWEIHSFRFGDLEIAISYCISELCELVENQVTISRCCSTSSTFLTDSHASCCWTLLRTRAVLVQFDEEKLLIDFEFVNLLSRATWENELAFKGTVHWRLQRCQPEYFLSKTVSCIIYIVYLEIIASKERRHFPTKMSGDVVRSKRFCVSCVEIC